MGYEWLWQAFNRLSTTRAQGFSQGSIDYLKLVEYAKDLSMSPREREFLWDVIKKLDQAFLKRVAKKTTPPKTPPPRR